MVQALFLKQLVVSNRIVLVSEAQHIASEVEDFLEGLVIINDFIISAEELMGQLLLSYCQLLSWE